jgi:hypothetical protein
VREPLFPNHTDSKGRPGPVLLCLQALFHDASEGLGLRDLPSPVKQLPEMAGYRALEKGVMDAVMSHLGLPLRLHQLVKAADYRMCQTEAKWFLGDLHPDWETSTEFPAYDMPAPRVWNAQEAQDKFMEAYRSMLKAADDYAARKSADRAATQVNGAIVQAFRNRGDMPLTMDTGRLLGPGRGYRDSFGREW